MSQKRTIIILAVIIAILSAVTGYRYLDYINNEPSFCSLCHLTEEGYNSWERSEHHFLKCQECHEISVFEGNKLLLARVAGSSSVEQSHGTELPWQKCRACHDSEAAQGSITFRKSYGHARHVFMQNMTCNQCHGTSLHDFTVDSVNCRTCHSDKLVHGMGTAGLFCLNCHVFTESNHKMTSSERCFQCHEDVPQKGIMSQVECHECHHPHKNLQFKSSDCLGNCHSSEIKVGQHKLHIESKGLECIFCHKPHQWEVTKKNAKGLCDQCHRFKDPATFIY